ncbi:MAG: chromate transporter, partial [Spirochaetales bacterium]|nr:chromate transporter [Spirochaetales bacterium]
MSVFREKIKNNIYIQLFIEFFTLGLFTFGGGAAMIGLLEDRMSRRGWLGSDEVLDCIAVAQTLPGVIAVNMSVYVGYRMKGLRGALISGLGMVLPSFVIIILIAMFMD